MKPAWASGLIILVVATTVLFTNLGKARLWDRDEPRNAGCAREMLARGDWVTPMFNDELRDAKPVLLYWLIMSAYAVFGESEFAARFWSALLALGSVGLTYLMGRRLFSPAAGFWSALALSTSLMFVVAGRAATPDSVLIFCSTAGLTLFVLGVFKPASMRNGDCGESVANAETAPHLFHPAFDASGLRAVSFPTSWRFILPLYACLGLAVLAKGPVGVILPMAVMGLFGLLINQPSRRQPSPWGPVASLFLAVLRPFAPRNFLRTLWKMRPLTGLLVVLAIAAPWYVWVGIRTEGAFLEGFFLKEHFGRATQSFENHDGPIYYYPLAMLIGFFPWSVLAVPMALWLDRQLGLRRDRKLDPAIVFCLGWIGVFVTVFTIAQTKLPSYVTPCYPALALLTGCFCSRWPVAEHSGIRRWTTLGFGTAAAVGVALCVTLPWVAQRYLPGAEWLGLIGVSLLPGGILAAWFAAKQQAGLSRGVFAAAAVLFVIGLFGIGTVVVDRYRESERLFAAIEAHKTGDSPQLASYGVLESSWVFYAGLPIFELSPPGSLTDSSSKTKEKRLKPWLPKPRPDLRQFLEEGPDRFVIIRQADLAQVRSQLPSDIQVLDSAPYFLQDDETLVIVGRTQGPAPRVAREESPAEDIGRDQR